MRDLFRLSSRTIRISDRNNKSRIRSHHIMSSGLLCALTLTFASGSHEAQQLMDFVTTQAHWTNNKLNQSR